MSNTDGSRETRRAMTASQKAELDRTFFDESPSPQAVVVPKDRNPKEFVNITHPDIAGTPACTYEAFIQIYEPKGFSIVEDPANVVTEEHLRYVEANPPVGETTAAVGETFNQPEGLPAEDSTSTTPDGSTPPDAT